MSRKDLRNHLKDLCQLLKEEKQALMKSEGQKVQAIVEKKADLVGKLESLEVKISKDDWEIISLKKEIDSLQELNLLLTKQALSYQRSLLESIAVNVKKVSNTYSKRGEYGKSESINLVNQRV